MVNKITLKEQLQQLEVNLLKPEVRSSREELINLLDDDFFEIGSSGRILYQYEEIGPSGIGPVKMVLSDFDIHPITDEVTLTTYRIFNEETNQYSLRSSVWKYSNGKWRMFFHQGTKTSSKT